MPSKKKFLTYINKIWDTHILTNNGEFVLSLEGLLKQYSQSTEVLACANGTIVLQMAIKAMNITKEVITTPFTYVATTNALLWEGCQPVFVDIEPGSFTIDVSKIENAISDNTEAILATHVYGYPCNIEAIEKIALKHNLKVIYDASNAFGTKYKGKSIFAYGDISVCSLHATKLFHTAEGGALFINKSDYYKQLYLYRAFGHIYDDYFTVGINAKMSELHAAMGLCVFDDLEKIIKKRKKVSNWYNEYLDKPGHKPPIDSNLDEYNYAYYPVLFQSQKHLLFVKKQLELVGVFPRRYFYPSLNRLPFLSKANSCPVSEDISARIMCLPLSHYIKQSEVKDICAIINRKVKELC